MREVSFSELSHFTEKQKEAHEALKVCKFLLYGGAMGGGKSYWLRWEGVWLLMNWAAQGIRKVRIGLFCEDYPSLKDRQLIKLEVEFPSWLGTLNKSDHDFRLKPQFGGGIISFRNLDDTGKYASSEFAAILVDELTKNTKDKFDLLRTRLRWPGISDTKFAAATNPGSIGHDWVKRIWIKGEFEPGEREANQFRFVRSKASDNPHLADSYYQTLEGLPPEMKKAFLEGDWDLFQGQFFSEWRRERHVISNFNPPPEWKRYRSIDFGRTAPFCCKWYAVDYDGNAYAYREYYQAGVDADINFKEVAKLSGEETYQWTVLDSQCFATISGAKFNNGLGETIADIAWKNGLQVIPSPKGRKAGWTLMHQYLRWQEINENKEMVIKTPKLRYMECCKDSIRTIPSLVFDKHDNEDLNTNGEDHAADTDSYFLQMLFESKTEANDQGEKKALSRVQRILQGQSTDDQEAEIYLKTLG